VDDFRRLALSLPEVVEQDHFGSPSFRVQGKILAQLSADGCDALVKLSPDLQASMLFSYPNDIWAEPQWGRFGWTRVRWRNLPDGIVSNLLAQSWRAVASRTLRLSHPTV